MRVAVIINPVAGPTRTRAGRETVPARLAERVLHAAGVTPQVYLTERRGHAAELAAEAGRAGADLVVAWGGDGTLNEVAAALVGSASALGIVPAGSGNGLARELGIPRDPERALARALGGTTRRIDVGDIDGRTFVNLAGIGVDARIATLFDEARATSRGLATYAALTIRELWRYHPISVTITLDGAARVHVPALVAFANAAQYGYGARIAPAARIDDGRLDLVVVGCRTPLSNLWRARHLFRGSIAADPHVVAATFESLTVEADAPIPYHVDGEPTHGGTRLAVQVRKGALAVRS